MRPDENKTQRLKDKRQEPQAGKQVKSCGFSFLFFMLRNLGMRDVLVVNVYC